MSAQLMNNLKAIIRGLLLVVLLGSGLWLMDRIAQTSIAGKSPASASPAAALQPARSPGQAPPDLPADMSRPDSGLQKKADQSTPQQAPIPPPVQPAERAGEAASRMSANETSQARPAPASSGAAREPQEQVPAPRIVRRSDGRYIATEPILFNTAMSTIRQVSIPPLSKLAALLKAQPEINLMIIGYSDNMGLDENNQRISSERAAAVKEYLVSQGVDPARLESKGMGSQNPIASNDTQLGRQANRRIEFLITNPK